MLSKEFEAGQYIPIADMGEKRVLISWGVDVDAVAGWLGSYGGEDSANDISRGDFKLSVSFSKPEY